MGPSGRMTANPLRTGCAGRPQPGGIERDTSVLKRIHRERGGELAVGALVRHPGTVRVGDRLEPA